MPSNILYSNNQILQYNNSLYGTGRVNYLSYINQVIGFAENYSNGMLGDKSIKEISYNLAQDNQDKSLGEIIKANTTDLKQVNATTAIAEYNKSTIAIEFNISNMQNANMTNVNAQIVNNLVIDLDTSTYNGLYGNSGINNNSKLVTLSSESVTTQAQLNEAIASVLQEMKDRLKLRDNNLSSVTIGYSSYVSKIMKGLSSTGDSTTTEIIKRNYNIETFEEMPQDISNGSEYIEIYYRPMIKKMHGAEPSLYNSENGKHGLSVSNLFVFETAAIDIEKTGAIIRLPVTS